MGLQTEKETNHETEELHVEYHQIVLYNDDFNTFDHVMNALVEICKHTEIQAEQCTMLVHYKGRCAVKKGDFETLEPMCIALLDKGLTAEIE